MQFLDESSPLGTDDIFMHIGLAHVSHSDASIDRLHNDAKKLRYNLCLNSSFGIRFFIQQYDLHVKRLSQSVTPSCPSRTQSASRFL